MHQTGSRHVSPLSLHESVRDLREMCRRGGDIGIWVVGGDGRFPLILWSTTDTTIHGRAHRRPRVCRSLRRGSYLANCIQREVFIPPYGIRTLRARLLVKPDV